MGLQEAVSARKLTDESTPNLANLRVLRNPRFVTVEGRQLELSLKH